MRSGTTTDRIVYWVFADRIPVTKLIIISNGITFVAVRLFHLDMIVAYLGHDSRLIAAMPWTLFTYPLVGYYDILSMLFSMYWLWVAGGSLERSWGSRVFGIFFFAMSAISALGLFAGGLLGSVLTSAMGLWLPLAGVTVAFAMLDPEQQILFFFVIPMKLKYLALFDVVIVLISYGQQSIVLGIFALAGCAFSYWYVIYGRNMGSRSASRRDRGRAVRLYRRRSLLDSLNPFRRIKEYRERKRLRDFLNKSDS